jgi:surface polysaccharide O-acyltransferase-like enzyme
MNQNRKIDFDVLTIIACFAVVFLHCNNTVYNVSNTTEWKISLFNQSIALWCVPVFFMMTGANLLGYRSKYSTKEYFKKRILRTLIPLLFWSTIQMIRGLITGSLVIGSIQDFINIFTQGTAEPTYWFFYSLFAVYLIIPIISAIDLIKHRQTLWYLFSLCFIGVAVIPLLKEFAGIMINGSLFANFAGHLGYVILGYLLSTTTITKHRRYLIYFLGVLSSASIFFGSYYLNIILNHGPELNKLFMTFSSLSNYMMSVAVFVFICSINWAVIINQSSAALISKIAQLSFGIYLVHKLVLYAANYLFDFDERKVLYKTLGAIVLYLSSAIIVAILKKIKYVQKIIP